MLLEWMFGMNEGFDIVIGNPPYARVQTLQATQPEGVNYYKKHYTSATGSFDIYVIFLEATYELLNKAGQLVYILPHKFFQAKFGVAIRESFSKRKALRNVVRFGAEQVFDEATTYTCLLFLSRQPQPQFNLFEVESLETATEVLDAVRTRLPHKHYQQVCLKAPTGSDWNFSASGAGQVLAKLRQQSHTLGDITRKIFQGIATSADKIYVLKVLDWGKEQVHCYSPYLDANLYIERGLVKPFLMGKDVHRYEPLKPRNVVIFPYLLQEGKAELMSQKYLKNNFPLGWKYLLQNQKVLAEREHGRFADNWYCFSRPQNMGEFEISKIVSPDICLNPQMSLDDNQNLFHTTTIYSFIFLPTVTNSLKYLIGILNSNLLWFFLTSTGTVLRGGYMRFKTEYLRPFPIPCSLSKNPPSKIQQKVIENLVDKILSLKASGKDSSLLEREIDRLVYKLYNLTWEEVLLVEPDFEQRQGLGQEAYEALEFGRVAAGATA